MSLESDILVNNYGIPKDFAEKLVHFSQGDVEGAIRILEASEKDVVVLKGKFISSKAIRYGAFVLFFNFQTQIPEYFYCAVSSEANISKIRLELDWREFIAEMMGFMQGREADFDIASRIEGEVLSSSNIGYISNFFLDRSNIDFVNLKRFLISTISRITMDESIVLKFVQAGADVFKFRTLLSELKEGLKVRPKTNPDLIMLVNLNIEPILAPIGGKDIESISPGEDVLVKFTDDREISGYVAEILKSSDPGLSTADGFYGRVLQNTKNSETSSNRLTLEFGPGICGSFRVGSKVRVQAKHQNKPQAQPQSQPENPQQQKKSEANLLDEKTMATLRNLTGDGISVNPDDKIDLNDKSLTSGLRKKTEEKPAFKYFVITVLGAIGVIVLLLLLLMM